MGECEGPVEIKCSNSHCGVSISERQAEITEIFTGKGKPLCDNCYEIAVITDRSKTFAERMKKMATERAQQKALRDNPDVHEERDEVKK
ncbi:hypothetical protein KKH23_10605 [Patescibacteria group bacterium]|nr:hypothetical protein [Patescibacteria group bacterium]